MLDRPPRLIVRLQLYPSRSCASIAQQHLFLLRSTSTSRMRSFIGASVRHRAQFSRPVSSLRSIQIHKMSSTSFPNSPPSEPSERNSTSATSSTDANTLPKEQLALPEAPSHERTTHLDMSNGDTSIKLDHLGPMVINADGTMSRIANWQNMADIEKENTLRIIGKRNQVRLAALRKMEGSATEEGEHA